MQLCSVAHFSVIKIRMGAADCTYFNFDDREMGIHIEITSCKIPSLAFKSISLFYSVNLEKIFWLFRFYIFYIYFLFNFFSASLLALLKDQIEKEVEADIRIKSLTETSEKAKDQLNKVRNETKAAMESLQEKEEMLARKDEQIRVRSKITLAHNFIHLVIKILIFANLRYLGVL